MVEERKASVWIVPSDIKKFDAEKAFGKSNNIVWPEKLNAHEGDIVYVYSVKPISSIIYKCKVSNSNSLGHSSEGKRDFVELEKICRLKGKLFENAGIRAHGFIPPLGPIRAKDELSKYLNLVQKMQATPDINPETYDGSYALMKEVIRAYAQVSDLSILDYKDLNLVYLTSVGTWRHGINAKHKVIDESNLPIFQKKRLHKVFDEIWNKTQQQKFENKIVSTTEMGMFGTGFMSFKNRTDDASPRTFIEMCIDIFNMNDENEIYDRCERTLNANFKGMKAASASMVLHCLKPTVFPILNDNEGSTNIFTYLGADLVGVKSLDKYIDNCRKIKALRDENFKVKNYRVFDMAAWEINKESNTEDLIYTNSNDKSAEPEEDKQEERNMNEIEYDKNIILYGPPGTGKTYNSAIYAVAICDGVEIADLNDYDYVMRRYKQLKSEGRIAFTTFHQSYGYEEFIEGITPVVTEGADNRDEINYVCKDGVFKEFCNRARTHRVKGINTNILQNASVWNINLGGSESPRLKENCFDNDCIRIGWPELPDIISESDENVSSKAMRILLDFQDEMQIGDIVVSFKTSSSIDGIGIITGDYEFDYEGDSKYPRKRKVNWILKGIDENILSINGGIHLSRPSAYKLSRISVSDIVGIISSYKPEDILDKEERPYVFIIDEINRGNISKIFGELITMIEPSKREGQSSETSAVLPYSNKEFCVPDNVYILGTMNTADRSISIIDTALRRRFSFVEKMPDYRVLSDVNIAENGVTVNAGAMLEIINKRIEILYDREHTLGHAYFIDLIKEPTLNRLADIFLKSVVPLLQEYFFEDYEKIQLVLGDNAKATDDIKFIKKRSMMAESLFEGEVDDFIDMAEDIYEINKDAFYKIESYKGISSKL